MIPWLGDQPATWLITTEAKANSMSRVGFEPMNPCSGGQRYFVAWIVRSLLLAKSVTPLFSGYLFNDPDCRETIQSP
jgi:hypothetical protein